MEVNSVIHGDCLELMKEIPDKSIDMILCDLPYGTTACKWDVVIPFEPLWAQYKRIIKDNGAIVLTASQPFTSALVMSNLKMFKYCWVWEKNRPSGFAQSKNMPLKNYEDICIFSNGIVGHISQCSNRMVYNPQDLLYSPRIKKNAKRRSKNESSFGNRPSHKESYLQEFTNYPSQVLHFESVTGAIHPTQKPVFLFEYLIKTYTNEGDLVLDNCAGSGTTAIAAINTSRSYILMEKDEYYFNLINKRISEHNKQLDLWK